MWVAGTWSHARKSSPSPVHLEISGEMRRPNTCLLQHGHLPQHYPLAPSHQNHFRIALLLPIHLSSWTFFLISSPLHLCVLCWSRRDSVTLWSCNLVSEAGKASFAPLLLFGKSHSWSFSSYFKSQLREPLWCWIFLTFACICPLSLGDFSPIEVQATQQQWLRSAWSIWWWLPAAPYPIKNLEPSSWWTSIMDRTSRAREWAEYFHCILVINNTLWWWLITHSGVVGVMRGRKNMSDGDAEYFKIAV